MSCFFELRHSFVEFLALGIHSIGAAEVLPLLQDGLPLHAGCDVYAFVRRRAHGGAPRSAVGRRRRPCLGALKLLEGKRRCPREAGGVGKVHGCAGGQILRDLQRRLPPE